MMSNTTTIQRLPHALQSADSLRSRLDGRVPAVFLDYDGTLTPIVEDPADATLDDDARAAVRAAADELTVSIVSGRDLDDVRAMVDLPGLAYAGSHGFDMLLADGTRERYGEDYLDDLDAVERHLRDHLADLAGVSVERKRFAVGVHSRRAPDDATRREAEHVVAATAGEHPRLKVTGGKHIEEFRPGIEWHKGHALRRLMTVLDLDVADHPPIYVGDDVTDEDAFAAIADTGVGIVVAGEDDHPTVADLRLDTPAETVDLLHLLVTLAEEHHHGR
jgi:trehalose-phosphatase